MSYIKRSRRNSRLLLIVLGIVILALIALILIRTGVISLGGDTEAQTTTTAMLTPVGTADNTPGAATVVPTPGTAMVTATVDTPIHNGPGENYEIIARLSAGQIAEVKGISRDGFWWQIVVLDGGGTKGWVNNTDVIAENIENVPIVDPEEQPTSEATSAPGTGAIVTAKTNVNIRSKPNVISEILGLLETGQKANVLGINDNRSWWYIKIPGTESDTGWVITDFVTAENTDNVPIVDEDGNPLPGQIPIPTPSPGTPTLTALANVNIRSGPGIGSEIIALLIQGQRAQVVGRNSDGSWWAINIPSADLGRGWVSADYVTTENTDEVPVIDG
jgi:uncharacterized protein YgiM (DUF1202 family)